MYPFLMVRRCPQCQSNKVHRSHRRGIVEKCLLPLVLLRPLRCDECDYRYLGFVFARRVEDAAAGQEPESPPIESPLISSDWFTDGDGADSTSAHRQ